MQWIIDTMHYIYIRYNIQVVLSLSNIFVLIKMWGNRCNLKFIKINKEIWAQTKDEQIEINEEKNCTINIINKKKFHDIRA
jgi:hypothetical protein